MPFQFRQPGSSPPTLSAYQPSLRDKAAGTLLKLFGDTYENQRLVESFLGSSGLGQSKIGAVDVTPLGLAFAGDEAGRKAAGGRPVEGAADLALAAIPIPAAARAVRGTLGGAKRALSEAGVPLKFYHGSADHNLTALMPRKQSGTFDFPPVVSLSTDPKFAAGYAGPNGKVYEASLRANGLGDFRDAADVKKVVDFYEKQYGPLDANDIEAVQQGSWRLWENPDLWKKHGWEGAWTREEPGTTNSQALNVSLASGSGISLRDKGVPMKTSRRK